MKLIIKANTMLQWQKKHKTTTTREFNWLWDWNDWWRNMVRKKKKREDKGKLREHALITLYLYIFFFYFGLPFFFLFPQYGYHLAAEVVQELTIGHTWLIISLFCTHLLCFIWENVRGFYFSSPLFSIFIYR